MANISGESILIMMIILEILEILIMDRLKIFQNSNEGFLKRLLVEKRVSAGVGKKGISQQNEYKEE